jgi:anti-sigma B factor antagonist
MTLSSVITDQVLIITLPEGAFDAATAPLIKTKVLELIHSFHLFDVIINLEKISFIDSAGIGALVVIGKELKDTGEIKLTNASKQLLTIFEMVRLHKIFEIYPNTKEALRAFAL